ncbi:MAG: tetratricopeptide repeat protein, partial [Cyanobacteria bacterium J06560_5]
MPIDWASTMMNMATAYSKRIRGDRAENIENAIDAYKQSLKVRTREEMPVEWALSMNNLAAAYSKRIKGDRAQNLEDAIDAYKQSLQVRTRKATPVDWALSMNNLATTYRSRIKGDRAQNLEDAIDIYKQVLQVLTRKATPVDWANTIVNLANAYSDRIRGDRAQNLENAISAHKQALQVITREDMPMKWATVMTNLAIAYFYRIRGDRAQNLEDAIDTYGEALQVMTREAMPVEWSAAMMSLANAYFYRIRGERTQNLEDAIDAYKQSLQVRTREAMPFDWATVMMNLANPYFYRKGDRAQNLEDAIDVCKQALQVMTREAMPVYWAITMNNLALAYLKRIRGDRAQNLEDAIDTCKQSLQVRTREAMPIDWAATLDNLATAYSTRIRGDQAQNLENAIDAYKQSLRVRTREAMPIDWATSMHNLASTYSTRIRGDRAQNLENAIDAYKQSLQVRTRETMPIDWATSMHNLAMVNHSRIKGDRAQNLENAIDAYEQALMVFQPTRLPNECRRTARLLGDLCADGQRWHKATTAYEKALKAAEILYQSSLSQDSQKSELLENRNLFRRAAYALSRAGDLERATVTLELGRARGLSETLERDRADLTALKVTATDIYEQYQQAAVALRQLEAEERALSANRTQSPVQSLSKLSQQSETAIQDMKAAISAIRKISGYENFLDRPSFRDIAAGVQSDQPLVYIAPTPNGSVALIIHQEPIANQTVVSSLWLDTLTDTVLSELIANSDEDIEGWFGTYKKLKIAYTNFGKAEDVLKAAKELKDDKTIIESQKALGEEQKALSEVQKAWLDQIDRVIRQLWNLVMNPVCDFLTELEVTQAVLIPTGLLGLLPLHAAWTVDATCPTGRRYAVDTIQFSYIPNAQSLQAARAIADRTPAHSLLAVDEPRPTTASELPNSGHEVQTAITASPNHTLLRHEQATRSAIQALLPQHTALHFSGHGFA